MISDHINKEYYGKNQTFIYQFETLIQVGCIYEDAGIR